MINDLIATKVGRAPWVRATGSLITHIDPYHLSEIDWRENKGFVARLRILESRQSINSARLAIWENQDTPGVQYPMFLTDLVDMMKTLTIREGYVHGIWRVRKRGRAFGLVYIGPVE